MPVPRTTLWPILPHTQIKHLILRRYLDAWLPMMGRYNGRVVYIDGFAGPGRYEGGEDGSPIIALKTLLDHPHFQQPRKGREVTLFFIEKDERRAKALETELKRFAAARKVPAWVNYGVECGEFGEVMTAILDDLDRTNGRLAPTFAFIDPFGFRGVPLEVISRITRNPKCEALISFMYESINRFLSEPSVAAHFDTLFGTAQWRDIAEERIPERRREAIVNLYRQQLIDGAGLRYVRTFEMIDDGNRTEYFLNFGTDSLAGLSKMKQAMWRADPVAGQIFSDRTATGQVVLIQPQVDLTPLREALQAEFRGKKWVWIDDVTDFVLVDTPYSEAIHLRRRTLAPMERADPPLIEVIRPVGTRDRAGDYPAGTRIKVL